MNRNKRIIKTIFLISLGQSLECGNEVEQSQEISRLMAKLSESEARRTELERQNQKLHKENEKLHQELVQMQNKFAKEANLSIERSIQNLLY